MPKLGGIDLGLAALLGALAAGCTATSHALAPYRDDPELGAELRARAEASCAERRGVQPPRPFATDGCTAWIDGPWVECCVTHDIVYWCGGSPEERLRADEEMRACVTEEFGPAMGRVMFWGVRNGGPDWMPGWWRWGFGWPWRRGGG